MNDHGLGSWPSRRARISPRAVALRQGERSLTYAALADRVERGAAALAALGVEPSDRVGYLGLNDVLTFEAMFAAHRLGAIFVPLNHRLAPPEIAYMVEDSGISVLLLGPGVEAVAAGLAEEPAFVGARVTVIESLDDVDAKAGPAVEVGLDDPALFLYTSGTTGRPKAAIITHGNLTWNTVNQLAHVDVLSSDHALCIAPLFHAVGLGQITLPVLFKGGCVEVVPRFDAGEVLALIEQHRIASFSCVPTMLQMMTEHPSWASTDLSSLRHVLYGGSPVTARTADAWWRRGVQLQQGYGMTEAAPGVAMAPADGAIDHPLSVGMAHFFTDIAFFDGLGPRGIAAGERGELLVRGPHVFAGYWHREQETAQAVINHATGRWYRSGDIIQAGQDGWLSVVDRVKDVIISGGENVYPAEVEAVIAELPAISSAAVVARPDERWGEVGVAYVETLAESTVTGDEVLDYLRPRLAKFKLPQEVVVVDALPRNATGKVLRHRLREEARRQARTDQKGHTS